MTLWKTFLKTTVVLFYFLKQGTVNSHSLQLNEIFNSSCFYLELQRSLFSQPSARNWWEFVIFFNLIWENVNKTKKNQTNFKHDSSSKKVSTLSGFLQMRPK